MAFVVLTVCFLVVPIAELWVILAVADRIGVPETIVLVVLVALAGAWLMKVAGLGVLRRLTTRVGRGELPTDELVDGVVVLGAGALLLTPGFITDTVGLLMLTPPARALVRPQIKRWAENKVTGRVTTIRTGFGGPGPSGRGGGFGSVIDVDEPGDGDDGDGSPGGGGAAGPSGPPSLGP